MSKILEANLDFGEILGRVDQEGVVSVKSIRDEYLPNLLLEASVLSRFHSSEEANYYIFKKFSDSGFLCQLKPELTEVVSPYCKGEFDPEFLIFYHNNLGTVIHSDVNLPIVYHKYTYIFKIGGVGQFVKYENLFGKNPEIVDSSPGSLIVIDSKVSHAFTNIKPPAYSLVVRQS